MPPRCRPALRPLAAVRLRTALAGAGILAAMLAGCDDRAADREEIARLRDEVEEMREELAPERPERRAPADVEREGDDDELEAAAARIEELEAALETARLDAQRCQQRLDQLAGGRRQPPYGSATGDVAEDGEDGEGFPPPARSPAARSVKVGAPRVTYGREGVTVSGDLRNQSQVELSGTLVVELVLNGVVVDAVSAPLSLPAGETASYSETFDVAPNLGRYTGRARFEAE